MQDIVPNFLIIGDLKAATGSIYFYLKQHPDVFMATPKELRYFAYDPQIEFYERAKSTRVRSWEDYVSHFEETGSAKAVGEASPNYLRSPGACARIHERLPDAKLIVSLRNPADRLFSLYQMDVRDGRTKLPFDQFAMEANACRVKGNFYWQDLIQYYQTFDPRQIEVVIFEDLAANPQGISQRLFRFLGVDDGFEPGIEQRNPGGIPRSQLLHSILRTTSRHLKHRVTLPEGLARRVKGIRRMATTKISVDPEVRRHVLEICREDIERTSQLIDQDLSRWLG